MVARVSCLPHLPIAFFVFEQALVGVQLHWSGRIGLRHPTEVVALCHLAIVEATLVDMCLSVWVLVAC